MVAIPITGTSVDPARSLGLTIFAGGQALKQPWLFIVAPVVGGLAAAMVQNSVLASDDFITKKTVEVHDDISINRL